MLLIHLEKEADHFAGRGIAHFVNSWTLISEAKVQTQAVLCSICRGIGIGF